MHSLLKRLGFGALFLCGIQYSFAQENNLLQDWEVNSYLELESRFFQQSPAHVGQDGAVGWSVAVEPEIYREWSGGDYQFMATPFLRLDMRDDERSHFDLREFYFQKLSNNWDAKVGVSKVFWGVTESVHLVDVINQIDLVENIDFEEKLGQPMVQFNYLFDQGTLSLFYLPYFRERTFPGQEGRFRFDPLLDYDYTTYESDDEEWHQDFAIRWAQVLGDFDVGVYYFRGTSRDPMIQIRDGGSRLGPHYPVIDQFGLDSQWTREGWLLKLEAIHRSGMGKDYHAISGGFEYTFYQIFGSILDAGTLVEYHYDSRKDNALTPFNHDLFAGTRLTFNDENDTALLAGGFLDHKNDTSAIRLEFERRFGSNYTVEIELQKFLKTSPSDFLHAFRRDSFLEVSVRRYF